MSKQAAAGDAAAGAGDAAMRREMSVRPADGGAAFVLTITVSGSARPDAVGSGSLTLPAADVVMIKHLATQSLGVTTGWAMNLDPSMFDPTQHLAYEGGVGGGEG